MVKHIVMWKFAPGTQTQAKEFLDKLKGLYGQIEVLRSAEVAVNEADGNDCDAVLIATFDSSPILTRTRPTRGTWRFRRCAGLSGSSGTRSTTSFRARPPRCRRI